MLCLQLRKFQPPFCQRVDAKSKISSCVSKATRKQKHPCCPIQAEDCWLQIATWAVGFRHPGAGGGGWCHCEMSWSLGLSWSWCFFSPHFQANSFWAQYFRSISTSTLYSCFFFLNKMNQIFAKSVQCLQKQLFFLTVQKKRGYSHEER